MQEKKINNQWITYEEYIEALDKELGEASSMAHIHGWRSSRYEEGVRLRDNISKYKQSFLQSLTKEA